MQQFIVGPRLALYDTCLWGHGEPPPRHPDTISVKEHAITGDPRNMIPAISNRSLDREGMQCVWPDLPTAVYVLLIARTR